MESVLPNLRLHSTRSRSLALGSAWLVCTLIAGCGARHSMLAPGDSFVGAASWYGHPFHGRLTASGERFDMHQHTAAHRSLPFGTRLKVTNVASGRSTVVTINDRGPFVRGRVLDLSYVAAREIELIAPGVAKVRAEILGRDRRYVGSVRDRTAGAGRGVFWVQLGAFRERENAVRLQRALSLTSAPAIVTQALVDGHAYYRVRIGAFPSRTAARERARALADVGYTALIVRDHR